MAFNAFQLLIVFGLFQGLVCIVVLMSFSSFKSKSNLYLSLLILTFIGNIGQYWLQDIGLIDNNTMQLLFLPWQMLIAPLFYLYVHSLKIFNQLTFRKWILFAPIAVVLVVHIYIKISILSEGTDNWIRPDWVSSFYLLEEIISLVYCLVISVIVYLLIKKEKQRPNYDGFGLNSGIVSWINLMLKMGLVLAAIWIISLYVVNQNQNFRQYYLLWIVMAIVLNVLGFTGIFYTWKGGGFSFLNLANEEIQGNQKIDISSKLAISTPQKYITQEFLDSIFHLSSSMSLCNSLPKMHALVKHWCKSELGTQEVAFLQGKSSNNEPSLLQVPYGSDALQQKYMEINLSGNKPIGEAQLYYINIVAQALSINEERLFKKNETAQLDQNNKVYQKLIKSFEEEELYVDPSLDLNLLAKKLDVSAGYLSKVINNITTKSFNEFVNEYRVDKVKALMNNQEYKHYNIVGYGLEAGFNSKSTFYKAFQSKEGVSPGKYFEALPKT